MVALKAVVLSLLLHFLMHDFGIGATTTTTTDLCPWNENIYTFANIKNCSQFYVCINQFPYLANCPAASFYNPLIGGCNTVTSSDACRESESSTQTTEDDITPTGATSTVTSIPSYKDNICCGQEPGSFLSNPNDKINYVICQYPLPEIAKCPYNTMFDSESKTCVDIQRPI